MKHTGILLALAFAAAGQTALAKEIQIQENSSGLPAEKIQSIAATATAMGVKEPVVLRKSADGVTVSGTGSTQCSIKLSGETKILGVNCK